MKAVLVEVPDHVLEGRRRTGADRRDEMWDGVLHMVPPASWIHQELNGQLFELLAPVARARGTARAVEAGVYRPGRDDDWRVPDQVYASREVVSERGVEGAAALVVEIRSPGDETLDKVAWYLDRGAAEVLVVDRDTREVRLFRHASGPDPVSPDTEGWVELESLGVRLRARDELLEVDIDGTVTRLPESPR